jgi:hypothetical protein
MHFGTSTISLGDRPGKLKEIPGTLILILQLLDLIRYLLEDGKNGKGIEGLILLLPIVGERLNLLELCQCHNIYHRIIILL